MASAVEWKGYDRLHRKLMNAGRISFADIQELLEEGERIAIEGNRKKVMSSQDGKGNPMPAVTYRGSSAPKAARARSGANFGVSKFTKSGFGPYASGLHDNLTTEQYKELTGPPLAPRGENSRIIKNVVTAIGQDGNTFYVAKMWKAVVDYEGKKFLMAHFEGLGRLPKRDMRGYATWERQEFRKAAVTWLGEHLRKTAP